MYIQNIIKVVLLVVIAIGVNIGNFTTDEQTPDLGSSFINDFSDASTASFVLPTATSSDSSVEIADANTGRKHMVISNDSAGDMYISFTGSKIGTSTGILLDAQATFEINETALYLGAIHAIAVATGTILVTEK